MKKRKNYEPSFRAKVALESVKGFKTLTEISKEHKVHINMILRWKKELLEKLPSIFQKQENVELKEMSELNEDLYKEIGKLKMENDYLKKKLQN